MERLQIPFLGSVRWSARWSAKGRVPPWESAYRWPSNRTILMSFAGSLEGSEDGRGVRKAIASACKALNAPHVCTAIVQSKQDTAKSLRRVLWLKQRSVFCLEPPGMARIRKGVIDAILLGCIPILFITTDEFTKLWPLHFATWGHGAARYFPPARVRTYGAGHVLATLRQLYEGNYTIHDQAKVVPVDRPDEALKGDPWLTRPLKRPSVAVRRMQSTIATNAHKLVYSLDGEPPVAGDAVDVLLEAMLRVVRGPRDECDRLGGGWRCEGLKLKGRAAEAIRVPGYVSADGE